MRRHAHSAENPSGAVGDQLPSRPMSFGLLGSEKIPVEFEHTRDLLEQVRFIPTTGGIWFGDQRMLLVHGTSMIELRREIVASMGIERARTLFTRLGYLQGLADFESVRKFGTRQTAFDLFKAGPQLRAIAGFTGDAPEMSIEVDVSNGRFHCEARSSQSFESEAQMAHMGVTNIPACWMLHGYASGFCTAFMGRPVMFVEHRCRATGHPCCIATARLLDDWDDETGALEAKYYAIDEFVNRFRAKRQVHENNATCKIERGKGAAATEIAPGIVGLSPNFVYAVQTIRQVADTDVTVLFLGESGVGKEVFSRLLHQASARAEKPFIAINCAAIPESLIEAELFGVVRGAFTGASEGRPGRFERAQGGTLFLDEVGTLTPAAQAKLLRALQEREIERVGDTRTRPVDVRVVAATNEDLYAATEARTFRKDLYYRLNVLPIRIAPLRERRPDIPLLIQVFLDRFTQQFRRDVRGLTEGATRALFSYDWPGNVRELENMMARAVVLAPVGGMIDVHHLFIGGERPDAPMMAFDESGMLADVNWADAVSGDSGLLDDLARRSQGAGRLPEFVAALERRAVALAMETERGNLSAAARSLGLTRAQLSYHLSPKKGAKR